MVNPRMLAYKTFLESYGIPYTKEINGMHFDINFIYLYRYIKNDNGKLAYVQEEIYEPVYSTLDDNHILDITDNHVIHKYSLLDNTTHCLIHPDVKCVNGIRHWLGVGPGATSFSNNPAERCDTEGCSYTTIEDKKRVLDYN